jgi:serralysin
MTTTSDPVKALTAISDGDETARWNFPEAVRSNINAPAGIGRAVTLSYSFPTSTPAYDPDPTFQAFNTVQQAATRAVLAAFSAVAKVSFTELASGTGQLIYGFTNQDPRTGGFAYLPSYNYFFEGTTIKSVTESNVAGDVWINGLVYQGSSFTPGSEEYVTLLHETGHALGLKHPFERGSTGGFTLAPALDHEAHTVMSYTSAANTNIVSVSGTEQSYRFTYYALSPDTLMPFDIVALQFLYGANTRYRAGNDTYSWAAGDELLETIWDGGGVDTINCANQTLPCVINLNAGSFSSIGLRQTDAQKLAALDLPSWVDLSEIPDVYDGSNNLAIAYGCNIENATGGSGNDRITGNALANVLAGGAGNDTLAGGMGNDTYTVTNSGDVVIEAIGAGTDQINSSVTYTLAINVENGRVLAAGAMNLTGNSLANTLYAGAGNNVLNGSTGTDTASYLYATAGVTLSLAVSGAQASGGSGSDTLTAIENLSGSNFADRLTGSSLANVLKGGSGADTLSGGAGNDLLVGGAGADKLAGGSGLDVFRFDVALSASSNLDVVSDFRVADDSFQLENGIFTALSGTGTLASTMFRAGAGISTAADSNDHVIYNKTTGALYYDADGSGATPAVQFAKLSAGLALTHADFLLT